MRLSSSMKPHYAVTIDYTPGISPIKDLTDNAGTRLDDYR